MPKQNIKLTDKQIQAARPQDKPYKLYDTENLYLLVRPTGTKVWQYPYKLHEKHNVYTIGQYPDIKPAQAREERDKAKKLIKAGVAPIMQKPGHQLDACSPDSFHTVGLQYLNKQDWVKKHLANISGQFKKPIQVKAKPTSPTIISAESQAKYHQQLVNWIQKDWEPANIEKLARFMKLPAEYGIDSNSPDRWFLLAWHLATEHLTGLQIHVQEKKKGARVKWDPIRQAMLYVEVRDRLNKSNSRRTSDGVKSFQRLPH